MSKYLYGAAVQGIQGFIFGTNKLQDIVGASELVNEICVNTFTDYAGTGTSIVRAAGNIKHIFTDIEECKKAVREFPRKVMEKAPGITISQAVVTIEKSFEEAVNALEEKLKVQRNKPYNSISIGLTGIRRARNTGMPAVEKDGNDYLDLATLKKRKVSFVADSKLCKYIYGYDIEKIKDQITRQIDKIPSKNDWIAVIHADGNGLGLVVQEIGKDENLLKEFSENLNEATVNAAHEAYNVVNNKYKLVELDFIPIRPIVLGGDDLTIICRADIAIDFTQKFLKEFEKQTSKLLGNLLKPLEMDKLTACAGISFMKSSYPFYYGYNLAEELCKKAKEDAKNPERLVNRLLAPSCLMFYKIQDSFTERFDDLIERELKASGTSFMFGPYYLDETKDRWTIDKLIEVTKELNSKEGNALKSHFREWMSILFEQSGLAEQKLKRMRTTFEGKKVYSLINELESHNRGDLNYSPVYDVISLHTVINQETDNTKTK